MHPDYVSQAEAARFFGVSPTFISKLVKQKALPAIQLGKKIMIPRTALDFEALRLRSSSETKLSPSDEKLSYTIDEAVKATGIGRTKLFIHIREGALTARKAGRHTIILSDDLANFLKSLPIRKL
jgi:excisionase family DNA binding protein